MQPGELNNETNTKSGMFAKKNQTHLLFKGGKGGLGNSRFKSSTNQAPRQFTEGDSKEGQWIWLSIKLFADVGIIGKPNACKSTLNAFTGKSKIIQWHNSFNA